MMRPPRAARPIARAAVASACAALAACSLTDLSGFSGGGGSNPGGPDGSSTPDAPPASGDASLDGAADAAFADADAGAFPFLVIDPPARDDGDTIDLTAAGTLDWVQRSSLSTLNRCASCLPLLGDLASVSTVHEYDDDSRTFMWKNGAPTLTGADRGGVYVSGVGSGFLVSAAAAPERRVLTIYMDTFFAGAFISATLQGTSLPPVSVGCMALADAAAYEVRFHFAAPKGATLLVAYADSGDLPIPDAGGGGAGNIAISAATLAPDP